MEALDIETDDAPVYGELIVFGRNGNEQGRFPLQTDALMGRCQDSDIRVRRPDVSREHAMLSVENQRVWLTQLSKTNPIRVNNDLLSDQPLCLRDGDMLHISDRRFQFVYMDEYKNLPTPEKLQTVPQPYQGSQDYGSLEQTLALDSVLKERNVDTSQTSKSPAARKSMGSTGKQSLQSLRERSQSHQEQREERIASLNNSVEAENQTPRAPAPQVVESEQDSFTDQGGFESTPRHQFFDDNSPAGSTSTTHLRTPLKQAIESKRQSYGAKSVVKTQEAPAHEDDGSDSSDIEILDEESGNQQVEAEDQVMGASEETERSNDRSDSDNAEEDDADSEASSEGNATDEQHHDSGNDEPESISDNQFNTTEGTIATPLKHDIEQRRQSYGAKSSYMFPKDAAESANTTFEESNPGGPSGPDTNEGEGTATESSQDVPEEESASRIPEAIRNDIESRRKSYGAQSAYKDSEAETDYSEGLPAKSTVATPLRQEIQARRQSYGARSVRKPSEGSYESHTSSNDSVEPAARDKLATPLRKEIQKHRKSSGAKSSRRVARSSTSKKSELPTAAEDEEEEREAAEDANNQKLATPVRKDIQQLRKSYGAKSAYKGTSTKTPVSLKNATPRSRRTPGKSPASAVVSVGKLFSASNEQDIENYQESADEVNNVDTSIRKALATPIREAIRSRRQSTGSSNRASAVDQVDVSEHFDEEQAQSLHEAGVTSYRSLHSENGNVHLFFGEEGEVIRSVIEPAEGLFTQADQKGFGDEEPEAEGEDQEIDWENLSSKDISSLILNGHLRMDPALQEEIAEAGAGNEEGVQDGSGLHSRYAARKSMGLSEGLDRPNDHKFFEGEDENVEREDVAMGARDDDAEAPPKEGMGVLYSVYDEGKSDEVNVQQEDSQRPVEATEDDLAAEQSTGRFEGAVEDTHKMEEEEAEPDELQGHNDLNSKPAEEDEGPEEGELSGGEEADAGVQETGNDQEEEYDSEEGYVFSPELETISESEVETDVGTTPGRFSMSARYSTPGFQNRRSKSVKRHSTETPEATDDTKRRRTSGEGDVRDREVSSAEVFDDDTKMEGEETREDSQEDQEQQDVEESPVFTHGDLQKRTVPQLRELANSYSLSSVGKKQELIDRILSATSQVADGAVEQPPAEAEPIDYSMWTVTQLRKELTNRGLPANGKKQELISRLQDGLQDTEETEAAQEAANTDAEVPTDYSSWTVPQLRARLQELGMATNGKKTELIERLQGGPCSAAADEAASAPEQDKEMLASMKVTELRQLLREKGMDTSGKKADLIQRLSAPVEAGQTETSEEAPQQPQEQEEDYVSLKVSDLKQRLRQYGLDDTGRKAELINRLRNRKAAYPQKPEMPIQSMKVGELREALQERGLDSTGLKATLMNRLRKHLDGE
eukprot:gb/GECG01015369.1/.p1 GENE.gb/GECG01015369.1/~~gb/GECG01015369.1/.p1  ORF type:complete len:1403 (+),score=332.70 gb/GECG01015369.1/:1-4209(+)